MSSIKLLVHLTAKLNFCSYFLHFLTDLAEIQYRSPYNVSQSCRVFQIITAMEVRLNLGDVL